MAKADGWGVLTYDSDSDVLRASLKAPRNTAAVMRERAVETVLVKRLAALSRAKPTDGKPLVTFDGGGKAARGASAGLK